MNLELFIPNCENGYSQNPNWQTNMCETNFMQCMRP